MVTFEEFLVEYHDKVAEAYESLGLTKNARKAIVSTMRKYLGDRRFDPMDLLNLFQTVCYSAMHRGQLSRKVIENKIVSEMDDFLSNPGLSGGFDADSFPERDENWSVGR